MLRSSANKFQKGFDKGTRFFIVGQKGVGKVVFRLNEANGPPVKPPTRRGFGLRAMEAMIRGQVNGDVRFDWRTEGLACEIVLPP